MSTPVPTPTQAQAMQLLAAGATLMRFYTGGLVIRINPFGQGQRLAISLDDMNALISNGWVEWRPVGMPAYALNDAGRVALARYERLHSTTASTAN